jgi:uncharacterized protein (DUF1015 family)
MSVVKPFRGVRPAKGLEEKVAAVPYDVVNFEEAREIASSNPCSFLHIEKSEIDLDPVFICMTERSLKKQKKI